MGINLYRIVPESPARAEELRLVLLELFPEGYIERMTKNGIVFEVYDDGDRIEGLKECSAVAEIEAYGVNDNWKRKWMEDIKPTLIGKVLVWPTWSSHFPNKSAPVVIRLYEGMAFGTGEHPTTYSVLRLLQFIDLQGASLLDVGTGSGVLAIAAKKLGAEDVLGIDIDKVAVEVAGENAKKNDVASGLRFAVADVFKFRPARRWDVVLANLVWSLLEDIPGILRKAVRPGGWLIVGGLLEEQLTDFLRLYGSYGFLPVLYCFKDGWVGVLLRG